MLGQQDHKQCFLLETVLRNLNYKKKNKLETYALLAVKRNYV